MSYFHESESGIGVVGWFASRVQGMGSNPGNWGKYSFDGLPLFQFTWSSQTIADRSPGIIAV